MTGPEPAATFVQVCDGCGTAWNVGTVAASGRWTEPVLFGVVALAAHRPLCLGRLTPPCLVLR